MGLSNKNKQKNGAQGASSDANDAEEPPGTASGLPQPPAWPPDPSIPGAATYVRQTTDNNIRVTAKTQQRLSGNARELPRRPPEARGWVTPPSNMASTRVQSGQAKIARSWPHTSWHARDNNTPADARASHLNKGPWSRKEAPELVRGCPSLRASDNSADGCAN
jgi:hypothetical protein